MERSSRDAGMGAPCRLSIASSKPSRLDAPTRRGATMPCQWVEEARQRVLLDGLDFAAQAWQATCAGSGAASPHRTTRDAGRRAGIRLRARGPPPRAGATCFQRPRHRCRSAQPTRATVNGPWVRRISADQFQDRVRDRLEQRSSQPRRQRNAEAHRDSARHLRRRSGAFRRRCAVQAGGARGAAGRRSRADAGSTTRRAISARERSPRRRQRS